MGLDLKKQLTAATGESADVKSDGKKEKPKQQSKVSPTAKEESTSVSSTPIPSSPVDEAEVARLTAAVQSQGDVVREVKGRQPPASKEIADVEIAKLLELKKQLALASGVDPNQ